MQASLPPNAESSAPLLHELIQELALWVGVREEAYSSAESFAMLAPLVCAALLDCFETEASSLRLEHDIPARSRLHMCDALMLFSESN